ncbi:hypothetical protein [Nodularia chucula]|uniref:hypothetical protein n=1 Tax=Nodularia chucula TaxID=3093667 RepID=UPI0039C73445
MKLDPQTAIRLFKGSNEKLEQIAESKGLKKADIHRLAVKFYLDNINNTQQ